MNTDPIQNSAVNLPQTLASLRDSSLTSSPNGSSNSNPITETLVSSSTTSQAKLDPSQQILKEQQALQDSNDKLKTAKIDLQFRFNVDHGVRSVQLLDPSTHQVIMQYPSEAIIAIGEDIDKMIQKDQKGSAVAGVFFSKSA